MKRIKFILIIIVFLVCGVLNAQTKPERLSDQLRVGYEKLDWDYVEESVKSINSNHYYPALIERFNAGDSTLGVEEYRALYYGYTFQDKYLPLNDNDEAFAVMEYLAHNMDSLDNEKINFVCDAAKNALKNEPFNLKMLNVLCFCYAKTKNTTELQKYRYKVNGIIEAIISTGSGVDKDSPFVAIYRRDVSDIIEMFGGRMRDRMYITTEVEYFRLADKIGDIKGFYFNLHSILKKGRESRQEFKGFEFNPEFNPRSKQYINRKIGI